MFNHDPLEEWLLFAKNRTSAAYKPNVTDNAQLELLQHRLADAPTGKVTYDDLTFNRYTTTLRSPQELALAQDLYMWVWERGGTGVSTILDNLLSIIAFAQAPTAIPFLQRLLDLRKAHEPGAEGRRISTLAALALLVLTANNAEAYTALVKALDHTNEQVRTFAGYYLGQIQLRQERAPSDAVIAALRQCATKGSVFLPRYQARVTLWLLHAPLPREFPAGVYHLKVWFRWSKREPSRTIAICANQTLARLHVAIQEAFDWDADHLYSFYMNGERGTTLFNIICPQLDESVMPYYKRKRDPTTTKTAAVYTLTTETCIGDLGFQLKDSFLYFFDYGDNHEFEVSVVAIQPEADAGTYPRVTEIIGMSPDQYPGAEEE